MRKKENNADIESSRSNKKEDCRYSLVGLDDEGNDGGENDGMEQTTDEASALAKESVDDSGLGRWIDRLHRNLFSENTVGFGECKLMEGEEVVRFFKFFLVSALSLVWIHKLVAWLNWERDEDYTLMNMLVYDGHEIVLDMVVFYVVARLFRKRGVDHLAWVLVTLIAATYTSWSYTFSFLQHAFTLYEMHCLWPWQLWAFSLFVLFLGVIVLAKHIVCITQKGLLVSKLVEVCLCLVFFVLPRASDPHFHLHHWFAGWLIGMHANLDTWWSRATMAWCWGQYINGVAVYGRDHLLTCGYGYFVAVDQNCPFLDCYVHQVVIPGTNETHTEYKPMVQPDWRNCSSGYHP